MTARSDAAAVLGILGIVWAGPAAAMAAPASGMIAICTRQGIQYAPLPEGPHSGPDLLCVHGALSGGCGSARRGVRRRRTRGSGLA